MKRLVSVLLIALCCAQARADSIKTPYPYVSASIDGRYYFKMLPDPKDPWGEHPKGTMFEVSAIGPDRPLWSVSGWYAFSTYVSFDGKYLIRMGNWPPGEPSKEHLAIAFYKDGELVKSYSTIDLLKDPSRVPKSISHYEWLKEAVGLDHYAYGFTLRTVENVVYTFDCRNGAITSRWQAADAKAQR